MYKFIGYIPEHDLEKVKSAIFDAGAGRGIGEYDIYDCCAWQVLGMGKFRPLAGANPAIGQVGLLQTVAEWRLETVVPDDKLTAVVQAYKTAHPYEVPAYEVYVMVDV